MEHDTDVKGTIAVHIKRKTARILTECMDIDAIAGQAP
jgi:hypothetical protein